MKKLCTLSFLSLGLLTACTAPEYAEIEQSNQAIETPTHATVPIESTEILSYNGVVLDITDDNELMVKLDDPLSATAAGLSVNPEGVVKIALAAVTANEGESDQLNNQLSNLTLGKTISMDIQDIENIGTPQAYIDVLNSQNAELLQNILLKTGIVILQDEEAFRTYLQASLNKSEEVINDVISSILSERNSK